MEPLQIDYLLTETEPSGKGNGKGNYVNKNYKRNLGDPCEKCIRYSGCKIVCGSALIYINTVSAKARLKNLEHFLKMQELVKAFMK